MQGITEITGMVLKAEPMNDFDRRVVLLTKERGKISAFARSQKTKQQASGGNQPVLLWHI